MSERRHTAEGGTVGVTVTTANSGGASGDAFNFVENGGASTLTYDDTHVAAGTKAIRFGLAAGALTRVQFGSSGGSNLAADDLAMEGKFYATANPASDLWLMLAYRADGTRESRIVVGTDGKIKVRDAGAADVYVSPSARPLNEFVRQRLYTRNDGAGSSFFKYEMRNAADAVIASYASSTATRVAPIAAVAFGKSDNGNAASAIWGDELAVDNAATGFIGDPPAFVHADAERVAIIDATSTTGIISSSSVTQLSGTAAAATLEDTLVWSVPIPTVGPSVYRVNIVFDDGSIGYEDVVVEGGVGGAATGPRTAGGANPSTVWNI